MPPYARYLLALTGALLLAAPAGSFQNSAYDQFDETLYSISGPDQVAFGDPVQIVLRVEDGAYPNDLIAAPWSFWVDDTQIDGGFGIYLENGIWERPFDFALGQPGDYVFLFRAQDLGHGGGGHNYQWIEVSGTTSVVLPSGACCFEDCSCLVLPPGDCESSGGIFMGEDLPCDPNPCACPPPYGACCLPPLNECQFLMEEACYAAGGDFVGPGVPCDPDPCPPTAATRTTWGAIRSVYR